MEYLRSIYENNESFVLIASALILAVVTYIIARRVVVRVLKYAALRSKATWDDVLVEQGVFDHLPYLAPAAVLFLAAPVFPDYLVEPIRRITTAYIAINVVVVIDKFLSSVLVFYRRFPISKERPIKGYVQVIKIVVYIIGAIVAISLLMDQSPWAFLGGIGAMTAVLLLIFRDTILSFVASIQIAGNDMVRVGDWIEMPKYGADGDVIDMALNTVKVQNWDKTITTIPTYKLVEDSFKNWRGMSESGGRRIARNIVIDQDAITFLDKEKIEELKKVSILEPYLVSKERELEEYHKEKNIDTKELLNGRRLTNIGTYRAYVVAYLKNHPKVRQDMTFLVRLLAPSPEGLPLQLYVFTNTVVWAEYEAIQSDIFDHLLAALPQFGLRVFQSPTNHALESLGSTLNAASPKLSPQGS